jgi:hypothetical protein
MPRGWLAKRNGNFVETPSVRTHLFLMADPRAGVKIAVAPTVERRREMHGEKVWSHALRRKILVRAVRFVPVLKVQVLERAGSARVSPSVANSSRISRPTPDTMKVSARLKSGHE